MPYTSAGINSEILILEQMVVWRWPEEARLVWVIALLGGKYLLERERMLRCRHVVLDRKRSVLQVIEYAWIQMHCRASGRVATTDE